MPKKHNSPSQYGTKPLQKCVDVKNIRDWVPMSARQRIDLTKAWGIIRDQFCAAVVARGVCPIQCERCKHELVDLFRLEKAGNPEALLTWLAKDHSARWIEKLIAAEKAFPAQETASWLRQLHSQNEDPLESLFPKREPANFFEELRKDYE